ncbi:MAG: sugar phosphate isomerase/epimerase [Defluviitaleaceae bacterium]|nr:sugar phosphate isomerase/epimerase [Defluviitaleaceae bacterium]MCL2275802.1 sugar phosphate isomerase/epimerase [Defluviitaleaceae bacterium]
MKIGVSSYSFAALAREGKMNLSDIIKEAKKMGFDGIEFADNVPFGGDPLIHAAQLKYECAAAGLDVVNYTIGADLLNGYAGGSPEDEVARIKKQVDIAAALGAPGMRHDATWGVSNNLRQWRSFDMYLPKLAEGIRAVAEYASTKGIRTMVENHGYFAQDSDRMERLVTTVAHPNFGLLCDMGNFMCADEDPVLAVSRIAPYVFHAHAKDFHLKSGNQPHPGDGFFPTRAGNHLRGAIVGHGEVPVQQCLRILKNNGYNGYVSIEFEGIEDPLVGISIGLKNLRNYINTL